MINAFKDNIYEISDGQPVRILGGARIVGRVGEWDLGLIDMQTDEFSSISGEDTLYIPGENFGVLRLRFNPREGNDFYLVVNEYRGIDDGTHTPAFPDYFNRSIMLKYTHTFIF